MGIIIRGDCRCCKRYRPLSASPPHGLCDDCGHCCVCGQLRRLDLMEPYGKCSGCVDRTIRGWDQCDPPQPCSRAGAALFVLSAVIMGAIIKSIVTALF